MTDTMKARLSKVPWGPLAVGGLAIFCVVFVIAMSRIGDNFAATKTKEVQDVEAAQRAACEQINTYGSQFGAFVDGTVARSKLSTAATLASPTATAQQKRVAARNYASVVLLQADYHAKVKPLGCKGP